MGLRGVEWSVQALKMVRGWRWVWVCAWGSAWAGLTVGVGATERWTWVESEAALYRLVHEPIEGAYCVGMTTLGGRFGCWSEGGRVTAGVLARAGTEEELDAVVHKAASDAKGPDAYRSVGRVLVVPDALASAAVDAVARSGTDVVTAILVEARTDVDETAATNAGANATVNTTAGAMGAAFSPASTFPGAFRRSPEAVGGWAVNPWGTGVMWRAIPVPVVRMGSAKQSARVAELAEANVRHGFVRWPQAGARVRTQMTIETGRGRDSAECLRWRTCDPLGGYSALSVAPAHDGAGAARRKVWLVAAQVDGAAWFDRLVPGGDGGGVSGTVAMLAAYEAVSRALAANPSAGAPRRLAAFASLNGEAYGRIGSRRLARELVLGADSPQLATLGGLSAEDIEGMLEADQLGLLQPGGTLYVHGTTPTEGDGSTVHARIRVALEAAAVGLNLSLANASETNPGLPPSCLAALRDYRASASDAEGSGPFADLPGAILAEYDSTYVTQFFGSDLDDRARGLTAVESGALAEAATLLARAVLHLMDLPTPIPLASVAANASLVEELADCFSGDMACPLVRSLVPTGDERSHGRVGLVSWDSWNEQAAAYPVINRIVWPTCDAECRVRFVRDFFADRSAGKVVAEAEAKCQIDTQCDGDVGEVCVGATLKGAGKCTVASARFIPAISPALEHDGDRTWLVSASKLDPGDPLVCESRWYRSSLVAEMYGQDDPASILAALVTSVCICIGLTVFGVWATPRIRHEIAVQQLEGRCGERAALEFGGVMLRQMLEKEAARRAALAQIEDQADEGSDDDDLDEDDDSDDTPSPSSPSAEATETTPLAATPAHPPASIRRR